MITVSQKAAEKVLESMAQTNETGLSLRLAVKRMSDGSFDYAMGFDQPDQHDSQVSSNGVSVIVAPTSTEFLRGATLDYVELEEGDYRFIFMNPNDPAYVPPKKDQ
jgi:iron-sulfur cluster assembly protein